MFEQETPLYTQKDIDRFWAKVNILSSDQCWNWTDQPTRYGYGQFKINNKTWRAHRLAYLISKGDIPSGLYVCHSCDNPMCCNPSHLWLGTHADNCADRNNKGRTARGKQIWSCKLTELQVEEIKSSMLTYAEIGRIYKISDVQARRIRLGLSWQGLDNA